MAMRDEYSEGARMRFEILGERLDDEWGVVVAYVLSQSPDL